MKKYLVLYNPKANNGHGKDAAEALREMLPGSELSFTDITSLENPEALIRETDPETGILLTGGDGTINRFVNTVDCDALTRDIFYCPAGTGNDFLNDIGEREKERPILLNPYLKKLPVATVKGKEYKVLNGVGYGIDGYCCEVGDKLRETSDKPINYAGIAIKGLLFYYKPTNAEITVDGKAYSFKKVWLAPTMNGRMYGGGMIAAPDQDRLNEEGTLSTLIMFGSGKIRTLMIFPSIFKGEHVKHTKTVQLLKGKEVTVRFDRPVALQIDGETILDVSEYTMRSVR